MIFDSSSSLERSGTPEMWAAFVSSRDDEEYYQGWLGLQSGIIGDVIQALVVTAQGDDGNFQPIAAWPPAGIESERLSEVIERVLDDRGGLLMELKNSGHFALAYPLVIGEELFGVVALETSLSSTVDLQRAMEQLQWGVAWLELLLRRRQNEEDQTILRRLRSAVDLLAATLSEEHFRSAAMVFTTETAQTMGCERVSLGLQRNRHPKLLAVSHSAEVGRKMNLTRAIERVMEEAMVQKSEIVYPQARDEMTICREHEELSRLQSMASIVTVPLFLQGRCYGAVTCERSADQPFSEHDVEFIRAVAGLIGPALEGKYDNDRLLPVKIYHSFKGLLHRLFGRAHLGLKLWTLLIASVFVFLSLAVGDYRLTADTVLEGALRQAIVVPFDDYIDRAEARAGDVVRQGDLLCALDERDLHLEKLAKVSKKRQMERQQQEAVAKHDRAQAGIYSAQLDQLQAEIELIGSRLDRTKLTAPFKGLLVSGDLSQRLGTAVEQGEILFELTPLDAYRVILKVDERRIGDVNKGQEGMLMLSSLPNRRYPFRVEKITPLTVAEEGRNYFRVEAELKEIDTNLRPGMEGVGKIYIDRRKLISIWARDLVEWLKMSMWSWLP